jgi:hypothetical protein
MTRVMLRLFIVTLCAFPAARVMAQVVPPKPPVRDTSPPLRLPAGGPPPARPATRAVPSAAQTPTPGRVEPMKRIGTPPDSTRPKSAVAASTPPVGAVALCGDGTFATRALDTTCASHLGVKGKAGYVAAPPPTPAARAAALAAAAKASTTMQKSGPPAGASMQCKDGTYLSGTASADRCANNGGLAAVFPVRAQAPPVPARRP